MKNSFLELNIVGEANSESPKAAPASPISASPTANPAQNDGAVPQLPDDHPFSPKMMELREKEMQKHLQEYLRLHPQRPSLMQYYWYFVGGFGGLVLLFGILWIRQRMKMKRLVEGHKEEVQIPVSKNEGKQVAPPLSEPPPPGEFFVVTKDNPILMKKKNAIYGSIGLKLDSQRTQEEAVANEVTREQPRPDLTKKGDNKE